jgi:hypothetical protein
MSDEDYKRYATFCDEKGFYVDQDGGCFDAWKILDKEIAKLKAENAALKVGCFEELSLKDKEIAKLKAENIKFIQANVDVANINADLLAACEQKQEILDGHDEVVGAYQGRFVVAEEEIARLKSERELANKIIAEGKKFKHVSGYFESLYTDWEALQETNSDGR